MYRYIIFLLLFLSGLIFASQIDYTKLTPTIVEKDLANCPENKPHVDFSCVELQSFAKRINDFAMQLQTDRLGYGRAILASQEKLAKQEELLAKNKYDRQLSQEIAANKQEINERLLIVKWLESPR